MTDIPKNLKVNLLKFFKESAGIVKGHSKSAFAQSGANMESVPAWKKLATSTIKAKKARGYSSKPLVGSGALAGGMTEKITPTKVTITNKYMNDYGKYHQSNRPRKKLPRRAFMELSNDNKAEIMRSLHNAVRQALNK